jgi:hypothetical protein
MANSKHWMDAIAKEVQTRALGMVQNISSNVANSVKPMRPEPPPQLPLEQYLQFSPEERQGWLVGQGPNFSNEVTRLQNEAVNRFGGMAQVLGPMFNIDAMQVSNAVNQTVPPDAGLAQSQEDLFAMLGIDPFQPET